jgi:hypothetical protein
MLGNELAVRASRWSRIRERRDGRDGGGSVVSRLRSDSNGDCEVDDDAIGRSRSQLRVNVNLGYLPG